MPKLGFKGYVALFLLFALYACTPQKAPSTIAFQGSTTGVYSVQLRQANGTFVVVDTLEIKGDDIFEIGFDTTRMVSFLPISGELPVVHAVIGPNTSQLRVSADGFISGDQENNWLGAQRKMQLDLLAFIDSLDHIR